MSDDMSAYGLVAADSIREGPGCSVFHGRSDCCHSQIPLEHLDFTRKHLQFKMDFFRTLRERNLLSSRSAIRLIDSVLLKSLSSQNTREFVIRCDTSVRRCLSVLLGVDVLVDTWDGVFGMIPKRRWEGFCVS